MPYVDPEVRRLKQVGYRETYKRKHPKYWEGWNKTRSKEDGAKWQRQWRSDNPQGNLVILARARAKARSLPCTITVATLVWPTHCPIFGMELDYNKTPPGERQHAKRDAFPTLDRKVPALGYVPGNVFVLSYKANRLKQDSSIEQLEALLSYMKS